MIIGLRQEKMITKKESSGKDIVYYCGPGTNFKFTKQWNPDSKTIGGSEEAVINLTKQFAEKGYNVTVYCVLRGYSQYYGPVLYRPYWEWIPGDKQDVTILWRDPSLLRPINSDKLFLDLHDAIEPSWLSQKGINLKKDISKNIKIMVKSKFHKNILDLDQENTIIIPNGIRQIEYKPDTKQKNVLICTSSPDRCILALLRALPIIRKEIPDTEIHWAYGFKAGITQGGLEADKRQEIVEWLEKIKEIMSKTEGFVDLGRLSQKEIEKLYQKGNIFVYGTTFPEIDCISLTKAMAAGTIPVVSPAGAMFEKINSLDPDIGLGSDYNSEKSALVTSDLTENLDTSLKEGPEFDKWVQNIIEKLKNNVSEQNIIKMSQETNVKYNWYTISDNWIKYF